MAHYPHQGPYQQQGYPPTQPLPVRTDVADQSTFMQPGQNNVWPNINPPRGLGQDIQQYIITSFRQLAQDRAANAPSPLQIFTYNMLSQNWFVNPLFQEWVQLAIDFADFLVVCQPQNNPPRTAADKAVGKCYAGLNATMVAKYPQVLDLIRSNQPLIQELIRAGEECDALRADVNNFLNNQRNPQPAYGQYQAPMQQGYYAPTQQAYGAPQGQAHMVPAGTHGGGAPQPTQGTVGGTSGRYAQSETWSSETPAQTTPLAPQQGHLGTSTPVGSEVMQQDLTQYDHPAPKDLSEIVFDPDHFRPQGVTTNEDRPWDVIYAPGGVEARPAHLSGWKVERSEEEPWSTGYDPTVYCLYHVRWPDGYVQEHPIEWSFGMDYLKHEISERLRRVKLKSDGKVVSNNTKLTVYGDQVQTVSEAVTLAKDGKLTPETPVLIEEVIMGTTEEDCEDQAMELLKKELELKEGDPVPAHEYHSVKAFPLDISQEGLERLQLLGTADSFPGLARGLEEALSDGVISLRTYRVFNRKLTTEINKVLKDHLSQTIQITDFGQDIKELYPYLQGRNLGDLVTVITSRTKSILQRVFQLEVGGGEGTDEPLQVDLVEAFINVRVGWASNELESVVQIAPNAKAGSEPVLISKTYHPKLHFLVDDVLRRNASMDRLHGKTVRIISADGVYYEIFKGWLVEGALLIKRID